MTETEKAFWDAATDLKNASQTKEWLRLEAAFDTMFRTYRAVKEEQTTRGEHERSSTD